MRKAIIIGASSGIGLELARRMYAKGYAVGLAGRRVELLKGLQKELQGRSYVKRIDVADPSAMDQLKELIAEMGGADVVIVSSGTGFINPGLEWGKEKETIDVNVSGFAAMANVAFEYFRGRGSGHLVGISSIAAIRGGGEAPAYNASKAFASNYLEGLRQKAGKLKLPITVTDIQPGFVDTAMAQGEGLFWVAPARKAARQIFSAIEKKKSHAYVTKRWRLIAWLLKLIPGRLYCKL
ncbi:MAG: oxidoreductase [Elusimicrobia bacterium RIFOXYA12_FULL_51_18]|nr:MAG: oxidoreductase [Elusimicrobia bacterium RIFOXYA12_FULL_51_18]OGS30313.1 MAG: oxidoreductase [Elusimicrobia bacterium RIFOXYA2_FULL_53_38]